jgi:hypothetical protein
MGKNKNQKPPKDVRDAPVTTLVLEVRAQDGSPLRQKDKLKLRKSMRQLLRSANQMREPSDS